MNSRNIRIKFLVIGFAAMLFTPVIGMGNVAKDTKASLSTTVIGQNNPSVDLQNIQNAVSNYDVVTLKGTFNLGDTGSVIITKDVEIIGDGTAKIMGGEKTFDSSNGKIKLMVKNLYMENASYSAIHVMKSAGLEVSGCTIKNIRPKFHSTGPWAYFPMNLPISVTTVPMPAFNRASPGDITGDIVIKNNYIDMNGTGQYSGVIHAAILIQGLNTNVLISQNKVYNCVMAGILLDQNKGLTTISHNTIKPGNVKYDPWGGMQTNEGIYVGHHTGNPNYLGNTAVPQGDLIITRNNITIEGPVGDAVLIHAFLHNADANISVLHNNITMIDTPPNIGWGLAAYGSGPERADNITWAYNKIQGKMDAALFAYKANNNTFKANNLTGAETQSADTIFWYYTSNNTLIGYPGSTVIDVGEGNIITGGSTKKQLGPELSQRIKEAVDRKKDLLRDAKKSQQKI